MTNSSDNLNTNNSLENVVSFNCHMNVHAYSLQRPSVFIDQQVDVHVINTSHDFNNDETSLQDNLISQQFNDNISQDTHVFNTLSTAELSSTPEAQQVHVPDSQVDTHDASLPSITTSFSTESTQHVSINLHDNQNQSLSQGALSLGLKDKGFRIGHLNIQGISNKIDQLKLLLQSQENLIHVLGLSETKLNERHPDTPFEINGYQKPFRRDRSENAGGGLLVYVKEGICCKRRSDLEHQMLECVWVEIKPLNSCSYLVGNMYRPPNSTVQWNEFFEDSIEKVLQEEKEIFLLGDINRDLINEQIKRSWADYMEPYGLDQLVVEPTRITSDSRTLIDHIYCNCPETVKSVHVPKLGLSDHFPVIVTRKLHNNVLKKTHHCISYRSFKNFDETKFISDLQAVPWDLIRLFDDTDDVLEAWTDLFLQVVDKNLPIKQHRVKRETQPEWLTPEILDAMKKRDRHKSLRNDYNYKWWRNKVNKLIKESKKNRYQTYIENNKDKPGSIYKLFQDVGAGKRCRKQLNISSVNNNGIQTGNPTEIANIFNNFFVNIASKIKEPVEPSNHDKLKEFCNSKLPENTKFSLHQLEKDKVLKYLSTMDSSKATGSDNIGPRLLKFAAPYIADDITFICNHSISTSSFPQKWKEAKVSPLHKNGPHDDVNNYRPISILPVLSKVLEKHVHDCLSTYLNEHNLLHKTQSGFRTKHSCETALVNMIDSWLNAMDNGKMVGVVLVDFKKAFDLVDHQILLSKLELYGMDKEALTWFNTYLTQRKQQVSINDSKSNFETVSCGVPQGSILGPLLFLLFINDLPLYVDNVFADLYADDTTLYDIQSSMEQIEENLQLSLNKLHVWCRNNGMVLNSAKTKVMLITTNQKRQRLCKTSFNLKYKDDSLNMTSSDKILGVFVDNNLLWADHVKHICKKISTYIWLLSKLNTSYLRNIG